MQSQLNIDDFSLESLDPLRKWAGRHFRGANYAIATNILLLIEQENR